MTWAVGNQWCISNNATLCSILNSTELSIVNNWRIQQYPYYESTVLWTGAYRVNDQSAWTWLDGSPWSFTFWGPSEGRNGDSTYL